MSKIVKILKSKAFLTGVSIAVAVITVTSSTLGIMLPSYYSWKDYYDAAVADRDYKKYLQSLPLECLGITAELNDNVLYYDNGKAAPQTGDFSVVVHFTEKGKEFDEILQPNGFEIEVPKGFASNGGAVTVKYMFTPEPDEVVTKDEETGEDKVEIVEKEPIAYTAEVECSLTDVVPTRIELKERPYRIYYSNDMAFDTDGVTAAVTFNDGHVEEVSGKELSASPEKLATGTESATVTWSRGGTEMKFDADITVVDKEDYSDGDVYALSQEGVFYIADGARTADAMPPIRATYFSGNRLLLNSSNCTVKGNVQYASYTKTCVLDVALKTDASVFTKVLATVTTGAEAEDLHFTGSVTEEDHADATVVVAQKGATISAVLVVDALAKPDLYLQAAAKGDEDLVLADVIKLTVRGNEITIPDNITVPAGDGLYRVTLPGALLFEGENTVTVEFIGDDSNKLMIDRVDIEGGYKGTFYPSTENYLVTTAKNGTKAEFETDFAKNWGSIGGRSYGHGMCSDGTYLYVVGTGYKNAGIGRASTVVKLDLNTKAEIAKSKALDELMLEATAGITYYEGNIIIYYMDGRKMYVKAADFVEGCEFKEYHGFDDFEGLEPEVVTVEDEETGESEEVTQRHVFYDVYYNTALQRFAVFENGIMELDVTVNESNGAKTTTVKDKTLIKHGKVHLFDKDKRLIKTISIADADSRRLTGSSEYIYVNYTNNGQYSPKVEVYDWEGEYIGQQTIPVDPEFLSMNGVYITGKTNVQGLTVINGDFYLTFLRFTQKNGDTTVFGDSCCIFKVAMRGLSNRLNPDLTFSEYIEVCDKEEVTPLLAAEPTIGTHGMISGTSHYTHGAVQFGDYLYLSSSSSGNETFITKVSLPDYKVVCKSKSTPALSGASGDNSRIFVKDGTLYLTAGYSVYSIALAEFENGCELAPDEDMTALLTQDGQCALVSATYNAREDKYAVLCQPTIDNKKVNRLCVLNGDGTVAVDLFDADIGGYTISSVCCDDNYFYVSYRVNNQTVIPRRLYTFDGTLVGVFNSSVVPGVNTVSGVSGHNVQIIYFVNGELHAGICSWNTSAFFDWTLIPDYLTFRKISSFGDYLDNCAQDDVAPKLSLKATVGEHGAISNTANYSKGGVQYGEYVYLASGGNGNARIYKVRISDWTVVATSATYNVAATVNAGDNTRLFVKDGVLYATSGDVFSIELDSFADGCVFTKDEAMTALLTQNGKYAVKSAAYNAKVDKYAVIYQVGTGGNSSTYGMYVLNGDGTVAIDAFTHEANGYKKPSSVIADDDYFYVSYTNNGQFELPIEVFSWNGDVKFSLNALGMTPCMLYFGNSSYNVQAIYFVNGELHASICTWTNGKIMYYDMTVEADMSVFD